MHRQYRAMLTVAAVTTVLRVAAVLAFAPLVAGDSIRYRNPAHPLLPFEVWHSWGPGVLAQTIFLLPGRWGLVAQVLISSALWTAAGLLLASTARRRGWLAFLAVLAWSLNPWVLIWDTWYLTEATTIAGCVAAVVGAVVAVLDKGRARAGLLLAAVGFAVAVLSRPFSGALLAPILLLTLVLSWRTLPRRLWVAHAAVGALLVAFMAWQVVEFEYVAGSGFIVSARASERLGVRGVDTGYLQAAKAHGMPSCAPVEQALQTQPPIVRLHTARTATCPGYRAWLASGGLSWEAELAAEPAATLGAFVNPSYWAISVRQYAPLDSRFRWVMNRAGWADAALKVGNVVTFAASALSALLGLDALVRRRRWPALGFAAASLAWVGVFVFVMWADTGIENWRHALPGLVVVAPMGWALLVASSPLRRTSVGGSR